MGTGVPDVREKGDQNGQRVLLTSSQPEDAAEEQRPPNGSARLTRATIKRGGGVTQQRALPMCSQGRDGDTLNRTHALPARSQEIEEVGRLPTQQRALPAHSQGIEGDTLTGQIDPPVHSQEMEEGGDPPPRSARYPCAARG